MPTETVLSLIQKSTAFFEEKGIGEAKLSAEHLLAHALKQKRLQMYLRFEQPVSEEEITCFRALVRRRLQNEPVQYIVGNTEFYGLEFEVSPAVLIPRSDTEHLIDAVLDLHKNELLRPDLRILDIGTGSGAIAVALASQLTAARFTATDISTEALALAGRNAEMHACSSRIRFLAHDIFNGTIDGESTPFDVVVSNPPYIPHDEIAALQPEIKEHEPLIAATDGGDGLRFYRRIAERLHELLIPGGLLVVEIGHGQSQAVTEIFSSAGLSGIEVRKDYAGIDRVVSGWLR
jgi:release factor glutamine methyltransferase